MDVKRIRVWDLPTRAVHWLLVPMVAAAIVTGELGGNLMGWHARIGIGMVALVVFRLFWGVWGSTYARFAQFFPSPARIRCYLAGRWQGEGHNPLGALSVLGLLLLLACQVLSGLFANDDLGFVGPLYDWVGRDLSDRLSSLHHLLAKLLLGLVALHVGAVMYYVRCRQQDLLGPMLRGWKFPAAGESASGGGVAAGVIAGVLALAAAYGASGAWLH